MKPRPIVLAALATFATSFAVGCAAPMSAVRDDNRRLSDTVAELRADRRAQDRKLSDLQHELDLARAKQVEAATGAAPANLPVEVVGAGAGAPASPSEPRVVAIADDGTEIVYEGDAAAGKTAVFAPDEPPASPAPAPRTARRVPAPSAPSPTAAVPTSDDRLEVTAPAATIPAARRAARAPTTRTRDLPTERAAIGGDPAADYRAAVELVKSGPFPDAVAALKAFIAKYPRHDYADNAQYWLGEAYYAQKDYARALVEFRAVIEVYPRGNKVPDALLKVGFTYAALGQQDKAKAVLAQVVSLYPKSEPAALAAKRLEGSK